VSRLALFVTALLAGFGAPAASAHAALPPIHHVFIIVEENESASVTFGPNSPAPYLAKTLRADGAYLPNYHGIGHDSLDNYIAMVSGQAPTPFTSSDCQFYSDLEPGTITSYGQAASAAGCIYPTTVPTIASQLIGAGLTWRDYNDGMGADPTRETSVCGHPTVNSQDHTQTATATDQYATRHNPFMYFQSIIGDTELCDTHVVNLEDDLPQDLANPANYSFITPNLCDDGHDSPCANGQPGGLTQANAFLETWVPQIINSKAFKQDGGLLIITFDEASTSDTTSCCGEIPGPSDPEPGITGPGGGDTGAVLISPFIKPGTVTQTPYNHYTMLRSIEDMFGLSHIGYAQLPGETSFGSDIFACAPAKPPVPVKGKLPAGSELEKVTAKRHGTKETLTLYSVGASALKVTVKAKHKKTVTIKHALVPCTSYSFSLPGGKGHSVGLSAVAYSGTQTASTKY
jgi:phosphatidylinositol-3-phosphatase